MAAKQVILYFDNNADALKFTLAASSLISGDSARRKVDDTSGVAREIKRATRILVEDIAVTPAHGSAGEW